MNTSIFQFLTYISSFLVVLYVLFRKSRARAVPPGPPGLPLLGNLFQIRKDAWLTFTEWKETYGSLVYITIAQKGILILNSHEAASDLLGRKGAIYSDRPRWIVACEIMCGGLFAIFVRHGDLMRRLRRAAHEGLNASISHKYHPVQMQGAAQLASDLVRTPKQWEAIFRRSTASVALKFTYGSQVKLDPTISQVQNFITQLLQAAIPGAVLADYFTSMKLLPSSIAKWKRKAESSYEVNNALFKGLFDYSKSKLNEGSESSSFVAITIEQKEKSGLDEHQLSWLGGTVWRVAYSSFRRDLHRLRETHSVAGTDSTVASLMWFVVAMLKYPEVQEKAQKELDAVVGRDRPPNFKDRDSLPYIESIVREILRWRPIVPLSVPHVTTEDDFYQGYLIPKGTICLPNVWALNHDSSIYGPDADNFRPDRHLTQEGQLFTFDACPEGHVTFGFGQRICGGRYVARNALFIDIACILWAITLSPPRDTQHLPIVPSLDDCIFDGLVVRPKPFDCGFSYRFPGADTVLAAALDEMEG